MNGREKIQQAFDIGGTCEFPAVICYEGIFIRDHWEQVTSCPWWYLEAPEIERQEQWRSEVIDKTDQDWFVLPICGTRDERESTFLDIREEGVFRINSINGSSVKPRKPRIGGEGKTTKSIHPEKLADTHDEIDKLIPLPEGSRDDNVRQDGRSDLAYRLLGKYGQKLYPIRHVLSPLWKCYEMWGFEGMMFMIADSPGLVKHACMRYLELMLTDVRRSAALGTEGIWIEECFTDMISPDTYKALCLPFLVRLVEEIRALGMKSIYYFCGSPQGKLNHIISTGADALSFEEGKKNFTIDIEDITEAVDGRCALLGNLDAIGVLQDGTKEQLRSEITRQLKAGRRNKGRFIMSTGSPVTPATPVERVRLYCDMVHEMSSCVI